MKSAANRLVVATALAWFGCNADAPATATQPSARPSDRNDPPVPSKTAPNPETPQAAAPDTAAPPVRKDGTIFGTSELMGTRVSINVYLDPGKEARAAGAAMDAALAEMARIEDIMSEWRPTSELSKLSATAGGEPWAASPELFEVLATAHEVAKASNGAFDPTFHGVGQLWSFRKGARPPTRQAIADKLPLVNWENLMLDPEAKTVRLASKGMMLGLGAIAKGYAVDRASKVLKQRGFHNHVVEAGGDTYASGTKQGKLWMVGVQDPDGAGVGRVAGVIPTSDQAVVTSGDYQRFFEHEGKRYAHILNPKTGWPIEESKSPKSVTLVAKNATIADAYCTAVAVMGAQAGFAFVEGRADLDAVIIRRDGEVLVSTGLKEQYRSTDSLTATAP